MAARFDFTAETWTGKIRLTGQTPAVSTGASTAPQSARLRVAGGTVETHLDEALCHLAAARDLLPAGDRRIRLIEKAIITAGQVCRGRPPLPEGEHSPERVMRYFERYGEDATMRRFPHLDHQTIDRYQRHVYNKRRGQ